MARAGIASRRKAEDLIRLGSVTINGKTAKLGDRAEAGKDAIKVSGKLLQLNEPPAYIAFYKPKGVICTVAPDPQGRRNVGSYLTAIKTRIYPIGQMDFNSEGLMLLTNDGDFAEKLQKSHEVPRFYNIKVRGHIHPDAIKELGQPTRIDGKSIAPHSVKMAAEFTQKSMLEMVFVGWTAVDIKGFLEKKGYLVERIIRKAIGQINLHGLEPGKYRFLKKTQVDAVINQPDLALRGATFEPEEPIKKPRPGREAKIPRPLSKPAERWKPGKKSALAPKAPRPARTGTTRTDRNDRSVRTARSNTKSRFTRTPR